MPKLTIILLASFMLMPASANAQPAMPVIEHTELAHVVAKAIAVALSDRSFGLSTRPGDRPITDASESIRRLQTSSRQTRIGKVDSTVALDQRVNRVDFLENFTCKDVERRADCRMTSDGNYIGVFQVDPLLADGSLSVWVSRMVRNAAGFNGVKVTSLQIIFARAADGSWTFVRTGGYLAGLGG